MAKVEKKTVSALLSHLEKDTDGMLARIAPNKKLPKHPSMTSGSFVIDTLSGIGGYPIGKLTEIAGEFSSGKTTLAITAAIEAQKLDRLILYVDWEKALDPGYAESLGLDVKDPRDGGKFIHLLPDNLEEGWEQVKEFMSTGEIGMVILDSISAMVPRMILETGKKPIGLQAQLLAPNLFRLCSVAKNYGIIVVGINQLRFNIKILPGGRSFVSPDSSGGNTLKHMAAMRIYLTVRKKLYAQDINPTTLAEDKQFIAQMVHALFIKNKVGGRPYAAGEFYLRHGDGVDNISTLIDLGLATKQITMKGAGWYTWHGKDEFRIQSKENLRLKLLDSPKVVEEILKKIQG